MIRSSVSAEDGHWRALYRLQTNWHNGAVSATTLLRQSILPEPPLALTYAEDVSTHAGVNEADPADTGPNRPNTIVAFSGHHIFTASRKPTYTLPEVTLHSVTLDNTHTLVGKLISRTVIQYFSERPHLLQSSGRGISITEMRLDEAQTQDCPHSWRRIAVFYSTGQYAIYRFRLPSTRGAFEYEEELIRSFPDESYDPVIAARFHCPLVITCTSKFTLQVHLMVRDKDTGTLSLCISQPAMQSSLCWNPLVLTLNRTSRQRFKAAITYTTPFFPNSWTIATQEFSITLSKEGSVDINTASAICIPPSNMVRLSPLVTSLQRSGQYIVASRADNTIDVYQIQHPYGKALGIRHVRTLFGHTTSVTSLSLDGFKCVSGGRDGRLKVWDLARTRPMVHRSGPIDVLPSPSEDATERLEGSAVEWLAFDQDKIVLVGPDQEQVKVLSFA